MNLSRRSFLQTGTRFGVAALVTGGLGSIAFGQQTSGGVVTGLDKPVPKVALKNPL